ncbi:MAG: dTDP-4-dehydrorhamnose 3,5-epimerase, partial [Sedimentisphaerales bacterium]|nr:dTDP-4-dehydrorhamnose 3,5-epimerase [Sedimentisphaerales bacterium]
FEPPVFGDARGFLQQTWHQRQYAELGLSVTFVQDNHSRSGRGILRGLHYQLKHPQGKLVSVIRGEIFDVAVDIRRGSPTFGRWVGEILNDENHRQLYIPPGFAHGFCVLSDVADVYYKCTDFYAGPEDDYGIIYNDPTINIDWPVNKPILSEKDLQRPTLATAAPNSLPTYQD